MLRNIVSFFFSICMGFSVLAQNSTEYFEGNSFKSGIYTTYEEFLSNQPSITNEIIKKFADVYIWDEALKKESYVNPKTVWGYSQNNNVYISFEDNYWRLINTGKLNHFSAIVIHRFHTFDPYGFALEQETQVLTHQFFDIKTGEIQQLNQKNLKPYFEKDPSLKKYFRTLKGKTDEKLVLMLRAINERHSIVLPYKK